jgi:uncharacterized protein involved in exopolysaccharide biosynthesis
MNNTPNPLIYDSSDDEIDLWELWDILWSEKWWIIGASLLFGAGGAGYSLLLPPVYDSKVVLSPVQQTQASSASSLLAQFAPIAGIAGIAGISASPQVGLATLQSTQFAEDFITRNKLLPELVGGAENPHDIRDAVGVFKGNVAKISSDVKTGLVTITVSWKDPAVAAAWANELAKAANDTLRDQALATAERNLAYLKTELPATTSVTVQQSIGRLLDQEMQTVMLARGNTEYAFKIIDPAKVPKTRSSPKRTQITTIALLVGGFLGVIFVLIRRAIRSRRESLAAAAAAKS